MKTRSLMFFFIGSIFALPIYAADLDKADQEFLKKAADAGMTEVSAGKIAAKRSTNPDIKAFAEQMVTDHGKNNIELKSLASQKSMNIPAAPSKESQHKIAELKKKSGKDFDDAYVSEFGVHGHADAELLFKDAANNAKDPDVKNFASNTLPVIEHHRDMANSLAGNH